VTEERDANCFLATVDQVPIVSIERRIAGKLFS
jgi:hypothetical protein